MALRLSGLQRVLRCRRSQFYRNNQVIGVYAIRQKFHPDIDFARLILYWPAILLYERFDFSVVV